LREEMLGEEKMMNEIKKCLVAIIVLFILSFLDAATTAYLFLVL
jgi:hypothetical protein